MAKASRECQDALGAYKKYSKVRDVAKQQLIAFVTSRIDPYDAVDVSLAFIEDNDKECNTYGLHILTKMVADHELRKTLLVSSNLKALLLALPKMSDAFKESASSFLNDLMSLDRIQFLNNWDVSECPITDERIIRRIIRSADTDDQAFRALRELAVDDKCKLVITQLGGAAEMARIYKENEPFSNAGVDAVISTKTLLAIDVLSSLTEDKASREMFAESRTTGSTVIWPLAHFVSNCVFLSTTNEPYEYWDGRYGDEYGIVEEGTLCVKYRPVASTFGKDRRSTLQSEENAGRALCTLSTDPRCRQAFLDLGNEIDLSSGKLTLNAEKHRKPYHSLLGWLAMASWAAEDDMNLEGLVDVVVSTGAPLFRVAWNLLSQDIKIGTVKSGNCDSDLYGTRYRSFDSTFGDPLLVRSIDEDLAAIPVETCELLVSRQNAIENFYIASLLLKMLDGSTSDSRSRIVELAAQSICALDYLKLEVFAGYLLSKTRPTDMSPNCIPFLVRYFKKQYVPGRVFGSLRYRDACTYKCIYTSKCPAYLDDDRFDNRSKCLNRLAYHYRRGSKTQIEKDADIVQEMRKNKLIGDEE